jgi:predicted patatin/cPLA2 family phospholipase
VESGSREAQSRLENLKMKYARRMRKVRKLQKEIEKLERKRQIIWIIPNPRLS